MDIPLSISFSKDKNDKSWSMYYDAFDYGSRKVTLDYMKEIIKIFSKELESMHIIDSEVYQFANFTLSILQFEFLEPTDEMQFILMYSSNIKFDHPNESDYDRD